MKTLAIFPLLSVLAACSTVTPNYDARFGNAVREARLKMTINPNAGKNPDLVSGLDGKAAGAAVTRYQESFMSPPPAVNVINIGGAIGSASGGNGNGR